MDAWLDVLGGYPTGCLDAAIRRWHADVTIEPWTERPRGSRMPTATELKASIEDEIRRDMMKDEGRFVSCGICDADGYVRVKTEHFRNGKKIGKRGAVTRCPCWVEWRNGIKAMQGEKK